MKIASVMLIVKDGLILAISRRDNKAKYGLIGGKLNDKEYPKQAAIREVFEETGIIINDCVWFFSRQEQNEDIFYSHTFFATDWYGEPKQKEDGVVNWITAKELTNPSAAFPEYNTKMLEAFRKKFPDIVLL